MLQALATAGAAVTAAALPASAQETARPRAGSGNQGTIAETLADYAVKLRYEDLPPEVVRTVKRTILDTIGCAIGGYEAGPSQIAIKLAARRQRDAGRDRHVQRHQDQPRSRGVRQRRDDPLSRFQRRLHQPGGGHPSDTHRRDAADRRDRRDAAAAI